MKNLLVVVIATMKVMLVSSQPGGGGVSCPDNGGFTGLDQYKTAGAKAAPLRGAVGCVDNPLTVFEAGRQQVASLIYGPMEAGFTSEQLSQLLQCTNSAASIPGGLDTATAELVGEYLCNKELEILDNCGGHAVPYHYHEKMTCLYSSDPTTKHSTRIGTALDGNGIYGKYIDGGVVPTDLDACGGRRGVTPDSNGQEVYYYVVQDKPPFTVGCFGPVASLEECKALYSSCGDDETQITTKDGTFKYDLDCPCFENGQNLSNNTVDSEDDNTTDDNEDNEPNPNASSRTIASLVSATALLALLM